ncbi:MAG: NAD+ synthase [Candidatus Bathyarchaeota archaeon]|nr:MAG: NAD+ synthase [Candidatus Bathyarchaeota archaeon]
MVTTHKGHKSRLIRVAMAQINTTVGDLEGNTTKITEYIGKAKKLKADFVVFPELAVTGYPPQDLLLKNGFVRRNKELLEDVISSNKGISGVIGFADQRGDYLYNAAAVFCENKLVGTSYKTLLPTYDVFDEDRYFEPAKEEELAPLEMNVNGREFKLGVEICEDLWDQEYPIKVTDVLAGKGAELIVNLSASPFCVGKGLEREGLVRNKSAKNKVPMFYVNLVGGQDELVFDGQSLAADGAGNLIAVGKQFDEDLIVTDINLDGATAEKVESPSHRKEEEMFKALVLGIRDYFRKTGFQKAIVGVSGGIDSALTTCIAVEALGRDNVVGAYLPSRFSSIHSRKDAQELAQNLGIFYVNIPIQKVVDTYHGSLKAPLEKIRKHFGVSKRDDDPIADENIQPRARSNCLMDISNRLKTLKILVLNTGNKTELALGYCTIYGDMAGGIGALGDVSKLEVYKLARYYNEMKRHPIIPKNTFEKRPSAELREDQFDPFDFDIVSPLVDEIIENRRSKAELIAMGYPEKVVDDIYERIRNAEFKRLQAAPCIRITAKAFGIGWKMPVVNKYKC